MAKKKAAKKAKKKTTKKSKPKAKPKKKGRAKLVVPGNIPRTILRKKAVAPAPAQDGEGYLIDESNNEVHEDQTSFDDMAPNATV